MTATTPIYGLSYPEGSDLVSTAPDSFKAMADTFEQALDQVDRRSTPTGVKPVIATTLNTLAKIHGVTGQTGYVTDDGDNTGMYVWTGTSWLRIVDSPMIEASTTLTKITTDSLYVTAKILDQGINCMVAGGPLQIHRIHGAVRKLRMVLRQQRGRFHHLQFHIQRRGQHRQLGRQRQLRGDR